MPQNCEHPISLGSAAKNLPCPSFPSLLPETIYGIDARQTFFELCDKEDLELQFSQLQKDVEATAILSTHAIIFRISIPIALNNENLLDPASYIAIAQEQYDRSNKIHLQLLIYLYTHCIIGESKFYARSLPVTHMPVYQQMIHELEQLIDDHYDDQSR